MKTGMRVQSRLVPTVSWRMSVSELMDRGLGAIHSRQYRSDTSGLSTFSMGAVNLYYEIFSMERPPQELSTEQCYLTNWRRFILNPLELEAVLKLHPSGTVGAGIVKSQQWSNQASGSTEKQWLCPKQPSTASNRGLLITLRSQTSQTGLCKWSHDYTNNPNLDAPRPYLID